MPRQQGTPSLATASYTYTCIYIYIWLYLIGLCFYTSPGSHRTFLQCALATYLSPIWLFMLMFLTRQGAFPLVLRIYSSSPTIVIRETVWRGTTSQLKMCVRLLICGMETASGCWVVRAGMHASASWGLHIVTWLGTLEVHDWVHWRYVDVEMLTQSGSVGRIALVDLWQETPDTLNEAATPLRAGPTQMMGLWLCTFHRSQQTPELWSGQTAFMCKTIVGVF